MAVILFELVGAFHAIKLGYPGSPSNTAGFTVPLAAGFVASFVPSSWITHAGSPLPDYLVTP